MTQPSVNNVDDENSPTNDYLQIRTPDFPWILQEPALSRLKEDLLSLERNIQKSNYSFGYFQFELEDSHTGKEKEFAELQKFST